MVELSRRHLLAFTGLGVVLAGCTPVAPHPTPSPTLTPTASGPPDWAGLADSVKGSLLRPGNDGYDQAKLTENPSYDNSTPLAVLSVASAADVATALAFAKKYSLPLAIRSGGHSYPGWSSGGAAGTGVPPSLVIDLRELSQVNVDANGTATVGAGAALAEVYSTLGNAGRALAAGSCATVGATGLTLGGGVGVLVRAYGLTCDALTELEIVTADGTVRTANENKNSDLFWACRGGGGGHLGVATSLTYRTVEAPRVTMFYLSWSMDAAASVIAAWQEWAPRADSKLWSTLKLLGGQRHQAGSSLSMSGTWLGDPAALDAQFAPFLRRINAPLSETDANTRTYLDAMLRYGGCASVPLLKCNTGPDGTLTREPFAATSHVGYKPLSSAGITDLIAEVTKAQSVKGMTEGGISMDALGGAVSSVAPADSAFVHRDALMTVQYTSTFDVGAEPAPYFDYVRGFRKAMTPHWGEHAYVNYADATLKNPSDAYFGANAPRLARIAKKYDPHGRFTQPQSY